MSEAALPFPLTALKIDYFGNVMDRLFGNVKVTEDGCWLWKGGTAGIGHGRISVAGHDVYAHRVAWEVANGRPPKGLVLHNCVGHPNCIRPKCLRDQGTDKENAEDRAAQDRQAKGEKQGSNVLSEADVADIWHWLAEGKLTQREIAELKNVSQSAVGKIKHKINWRWLTDAIEEGNYQ